jgi:acyl-CoA thioesterase YciA
MTRERPTREPALKVAMTPLDVNIHSTVFGGAILSYIDLAGAVHARKEGCRLCVTVSMKEVQFKLPVFAGDVVSLYGETKRIGTTSITVSVHVWAERARTIGECVWVTEAEVTYVNIDDATRQPIPIPRRA